MISEPGAGNEVHHRLLFFPKLLSQRDMLFGLQLLNYNTTLTQPMKNAKLP